MTNLVLMLKSFVALMIIFAILFSFAFFIVEADHDCSGEDCQICYQIAVCIKTLKSFYLILFVLVISTSVAIGLSFLPSLKKKSTSNISLITLKVKLSN